MKFTELCEQETKKIEEMAQVYTSAGTSIAGRGGAAAPSEVAALRTLAKKNIIPEGSTVLDFGAGKFARNAHWLRENHGCDVWAYDPFNANSSDGWEARNVSNVLPQGVHFDAAFSSYVLNVMDEETERNVIRQMESVADTVVHITRGADITDMILRVITGKSKNKYMTDYIEENYPEYFAKMQAGEATRMDAEELGYMGVRTAQDDFQRIPDLSKYGYRRSGSKSSMIWVKG